MTLMFSASSLFAQSSNLKTIVKDKGHVDREKVDAPKLCAEVRDEQQRLMVMIRPEFKGQIVIKEALTLEVVRTDDTLGYAAKCVLQFPSK